MIRLLLLLALGTLVAMPAADTAGCATCSSMSEAASADLARAMAWFRRHRLDAGLIAPLDAGVSIRPAMPASGRIVWHRWPEQISGEGRFALGEGWIEIALEPTGTAMGFGSRAGVAPEGWTATQQDLARVLAGQILQLRRLPSDLPQGTVQGEEAVVEADGAWIRLEALRSDAPAGMWTRTRVDRTTFRIERDVIQTRTDGAKAILFQLSTSGSAPHP